MDSSWFSVIAVRLFIKFVIIAIIVAAVFAAMGWWFGSKKYLKGYIQGQVDCNHGINKMVIKVDTTIKLNP